MVDGLNKKKIAIFYPWGDVLDRKGGASQRIGLLVDFLQANGYEIKVAAPCVGEARRHDNVEYAWYRQSRFSARVSKIVHWLYRVFFYIISRGKSLSEDFMLWNHYELSMDCDFWRFVDDIVQWADFVILKYTFWSGPVIRTCKRRNTKVMIATHDVLAMQIVKTKILRTLTLRAEAKGLKEADYCACVSPGDQKIFKDIGVEAMLIPHGIDLNSYGQDASKDDARKSLADLGFQVPAGNICLLVGSYFAPNISAVEIVRSIANSLFNQDKGMNFIVIGGCCEPETSNNFLALGKVDKIVLDAFYLISDLVLVPLTSGTGASIKTIEAMAHGKVVIGTTTGFRGYNVTPGVNCILSDVIEEYPSLIVDIVNDPDKMQSLGQHAREFSKAYNYHHIFQSYIGLIEESSKPKIC